MRNIGRMIMFGAAGVLGLSLASTLLAHGNVTPQAVDVSGLKPIGADWLGKNPYSGDTKAIAVGASAYNQNSARCHGLDAISGGIAPDLRYLELGEAGDQWYLERFRHGSARDGKVYMPPFGDVLGQQAGWAIRAWLETKHEE